MFCHPIMTMRVNIVQHITVSVSPARAAGKGEAAVAAAAPLLPPTKIDKKLVVSCAFILSVVIYMAAK